MNKLLTNNWYVTTEMYYNPSFSALTLLDACSNSRKIKQKQKSNVIVVVVVAVVVAKIITK